MENFDDDNTRWVMGIPFKVRGAEAAEQKFKVGDRVRVVKDGNGLRGSRHHADVGSIGEIVDITCDWLERDDGWCFKAEELELLPPFTAGQYVRLTRNVAGYARGDAGVVECVGDDNVGINMDDRHVYRIFPADALEVVPTADCTGGKEQRVDEILVRLWGGGISLNDARIALGLASLDSQPPPTPQPAIVARVVDGTPRPSNIPYVHANADVALAEAERLARNNPGQEFAVYQRVGARLAEVSYEIREVA